jgi:hypothetical protein
MRNLIKKIRVENLKKNSITWFVLLPCHAFPRHLALPSPTVMTCLSLPPFIALPCRLARIYPTAFLALPCFLDLPRPAFLSGFAVSPSRDMPSPLALSPCLEFSGRLALPWPSFTAPLPRPARQHFAVLPCSLDLPCRSLT